MLTINAAILTFPRIIRHTPETRRVCFNVFDEVPSLRHFHSGTVIFFSIVRLISSEGRERGFKLAEPVGAGIAILIRGNWPFDKDNVPPVR